MFTDYFTLEAYLLGLEALCCSEVQEPKRNNCEDIIRHRCPTIDDCPDNGVEPGTTWVCYDPCPEIYVNSTTMCEDGCGFIDEDGTPIIDDNGELLVPQ